MRRTMTVALGLAAAMALLAFALAVPAAAERGYLPDWRKPASASQTTVDQARSAAEGWLAEHGYSDQFIGDLVDVGSRTYVVVEDAAGNGAFELLVSRNGSWVHPAPTMMWNTTYDLMTATMSEMPHGNMMNGSMGAGTMNGGHQHNHQGSINNGMMGAGWMAGMMDPVACQSLTGVQAAEPLAEPLTVDGAVAAAQTWLDTNQTGSTASDATSFPGYVTVRVSDDSTMTGLIAVQLTTGTIWPFNWPASQ